MLQAFKNLFKSEPVIELPIKFCIDCKYYLFKKMNHGNFDCCTHPEFTEFRGYNLVTGEKLKDLHPQCAVMRGLNRGDEHNKCGEEAKLFEPKEILEKCPGELHQKPHRNSSQFCPECSTWIEV